MAHVERPLNTTEFVQEFFDNIDVKLLFDDKKFRDQLISLTGKTNLDDDQLYDFLVNKVHHAQILSEDYQRSDTLTTKTHRYQNFSTDRQRKALRDSIVKACLGNDKPLNDNDINITSGGIRPRSGAKSDKKAFLIIGGPASGKSTYANLICEEYGAYLLDSDIIKRKIPEYYSNDAGASLVHEESKIVYNSLLNIITAAGRNIITPIVGKNYNGLKSSIEAYQSEGYHVTIILINIDKLEATRRALKRYVFENRYVPLNYVLDTCGHEAVASFYHCACVFNQLDVLAINNQEKPGKIEFFRGCDDLVNLLKKNNIAFV